MNNNFEEIVTAYTKNSPSQHSKWMGVPAQKCPTDAWLYQEIIYELRPDIIIECGTALGGGALFLANMCDLVENGRILTIESKTGISQPKHNRIKYFTGSTLDNDIIDQIRKEISGVSKAMVILDSEHKYEHVILELEKYCSFVTIGQYLIIEDSFWTDTEDRGPGGATEDFLKEHREFIIDKDIHKFLLTYNPNTYLKRI